MQSKIVADLAEKMAPFIEALQLPAQTGDERDIGAAKWQARQIQDDLTRFCA